MTRTKVIVSPNVGLDMGGEAIKAFQYFNYLLETGEDVVLIAHARSRRRLGALADHPNIHFVEDGPFQVLLWNTRFLLRGLNLIFHLAAARIIRRHFSPDACVIHYLCPISPFEPRFPPKGYDYVLGPLNAHVQFPPAFRDREKRLGEIEHVLRTPMQVALGKLTGEKYRARAILVSGGEETSAFVRRAGAMPEQIIHVVDSGVSDRFFGEIVPHEGQNGRFVSIGRLVPYKGFDLAIEALARTPDNVTLDIIGDGPQQAQLEALVREHKLEARVRFLGPMNNDDIATAMHQWRGFVFPTLAEANGIVMQEAMAAGVPVITLRWGGPSRLAEDDAVAFVEFDDHDLLIENLAREMTSLANDPVRATEMARAARAIAERDFCWSVVAKSWDANVLCGPKDATRSA